MRMVFNYKTLKFVTVVLFVLVYTRIMTNMVPEDTLEARPQLKASSFFLGIQAGNPLLQLPELDRRTDTWQPVAPDKSSFGFSAFIDNSKDILRVRVIGVKALNRTYPIFCRVWYATGNVTMETTYSLIRGYIFEHPENHDRSWGTVHFICPLPAHDYPAAVSVVLDQTETPSNIFKVRNSGDGPFREFGLCLHAPFHYENDISKAIVEWVEMNRLLGSEIFTIYNHSSHPRNDAVFRYYQRRGLLNVQQWDLPTEADNHYLAQVAAMEDCLYRNFYSAHFLALLDVDEFIIPRNSARTWGELLDKLPPKCGYIARCTVYRSSDGYTKDDFPGKQSAEQYDISTLLVHFRQNLTFETKERSKYIVRTACVETLGIHLIQKYQTRFSEMTFDPSDALLHHYRSDYPWFVRMGYTITDDYMLKYRDDLIANVKDAWARIEPF